MAKKDKDTEKKIREMFDKKHKEDVARKKKIIENLKKRRDDLQDGSQN